MKTQTTTNEQWRNIPNYEGIYQVSSLGRVRRLIDGQEPRIIKSSVNSHGYHVLQLSRKNKRKTYNVHRLVAQAFVENYTAIRGYVVDHIDEDKENNEATNLQMLTHRENVIKSRYDGCLECAA